MKSLHCSNDTLILLSLVRTFFLLILLSPFFALCGSAHPALSDTICLDSAIIDGRLPNGMRYLLRHASNPPHTIEVRLLMRVGSIFEREDERGAAHFLEHMAFEGTQHFPARSAVEWLESHGLRYGRDINAFTGHDKTFYMLTLPRPANDDEARNLIDSTLLLASDWLTSITFDEERTQSERGTILEELRSYNIGDPFYDLKMGNTLYASRLPLGRIEDIRAMTPQTLRRFYQRNYTPDRATLMVVGDIEPKEVEEMIKRRWEKEEGGRFQEQDEQVNVAPPMSYSPCVAMQTVVDSLTSSIQVELMVPHLASPHCTIAEALTCQRERMLLNALSTRMQQADIRCDFSDQWYLADKSHWSITFSGKDTTNVLSELRRAAAQISVIAICGFGPEEIQRTVTNALRRLQPVTPDQQASEWCDELSDMVTAGDRRVRHHMQLTNLRQHVSLTSDDDLTAILYNWMEAMDTTLLIGLRHNGTTEASLTQEQIMEALQWGLNHPDFSDLPPLPVVSDIHPRIIATPQSLCLGTPDNVQVVSTDYLSETRVHRVKLSNGLTVLMRPSANTSDSIVYASIIGRGGTADIPDSLYWRLESTVGYLEMGGIEGVPADTLSEWMAQTGISFTTMESDWWHQMLGTAPTAHSGDLLAYLREKCLNPRPLPAELEADRQRELENWGSVSPLTHMMQHDPYRLLRHRIDSLMGNTPVLMRPARTPEDVKRLNLDEMHAHWLSLFGTTQGKTLIITGFFDPDTVLMQVRSATNPDFAPVHPQTYPKGMNSHQQEIGTQSSTSYPTPVVPSTYLLYGSFTPTLRNSLMLKLMRDIIQDRLISVLREREHITYSPWVDVIFDGEPLNRFYFNLNVAVDSINAKKAQHLVGSILRDLQRHAIPVKELESKKSSFLNAKAKMLTDDASALWRNQLIELTRQGFTIDDFEHYEPILRSITPKEIREAFREWLSPQRMYML